MNNKHIISLLALGILLAFSSCSREDDIALIYPDAIDPQPVFLNSLEYNGQSIHFSQVCKIHDYTENATSSESDMYTFFVGDELTLSLAGIPALEHDGDTIYSNEIHATVSSSLFEMATYTVSLCRVGDIYDIRLNGTTSSNSAVKMAYRGTLHDLNKHNGHGFIKVGDDSTAVFQLTRTQTEEADYLTLCDPTSPQTYRNIRLEIRPVPGSGLHYLDDGDVEAVLVYGSDGELSDHNGIEQQIIGKIYVTNSNGQYSIQGIGICGQSHVSFDYEGACANALGYSLESLW